MGFSPASLSVLLLSLSLLAITVSSSDLTNLVFKGCATQKFDDPSGVYSQTLNSLFDDLKSKSPTVSFYKTTAGDGQSGFTGLFQCRGDLSNADCSSCVSKLPEIAQKRCGKAIAVRIHLKGCYLRYESFGYKQVPANEFLYQHCGSTRASEAGFAEKLDSALDDIQKGVVNGFFTGSSDQSLYVLGQCEGDLGAGDCLECLRSASENVKSSCGSSVSGQVYLQECYVNYADYPDGVPNDKSSKGSGSGSNAKKTVAIILGALIGVGVVLSFLLVIVRALKKPKKYYGG